MSKKIQKSLQYYLSNIKIPGSKIKLHSTSLPSSTSWILSGCKHAKTLSFDVYHDKNQTSHDENIINFENFKSLHGNNDNDQDENKEFDTKEILESTSDDNFDHVHQHVKDLNVLFEDCVAISTYSRSPCDDFRRSMHEMIEASMHHDEKVDWDLMKELLISYLNMNEKSAYKYILSAFADVLVMLRGSKFRENFSEI